MMAAMMIISSMFPLFSATHTIRQKHPCPSTPYNPGTDSLALCLDTASRSALAYLSQ
jgi:hypothetical protein